VSLRAVLFDLDGTVLTFVGPAPGPGRTALDRAAHELYGLERGSEGLRLAGGTDRAFARALLGRAGVPVDDGAVDRLLAAYVTHLEDVLGTRRYRPIGDVAAAVDALRARGLGVGIATGNVRAGARLKLGSAGLAHAFEMDSGGYGCDAELRADIVRRAMARCGATGSQVVVVGDTEHDVRAARAVGARIVGVAIDASARAELEAAGADAIVDACGDDLVSAIVG
jgi:phosphoglycolate phosphatase-like HAD superfamily hydrolase